VRSVRTGYPCRTTGIAGNRTGRDVRAV